MKKISSKQIVYVLQNGLKQYGRFDIYGWDKTSMFVFATKFFTYDEAMINEQVLNYTTDSGPDTQFKIVAKSVRVKKYSDE
jgi:hypothetical protein